MLEFSVTPSDLRYLPFFDILTADEGRAVAGVLAPLEFQDGQRLFREGDTSDTCYIVVDGTVELIRDLPGGAGYSLATVGRGGVFGEMCLLADQRRSATAVARTDGVAWRLHRHHFDQALDGGQPWAYKISLALGRILASRLAALDRELVEWVARPPDAGDDTAAPPGPQASPASDMERLRQQLLGMMPR